MMQDAAQESTLTLLLGSPVFWLLAAGLTAAACYLVARYASRSIIEQATQSYPHVYQEIRVLLEQEQRVQLIAFRIGLVMLGLGALGTFVAWTGMDGIRSVWSERAWIGSIVGCGTLVTLGIILVGGCWSARRPIRDDHPLLRALLTGDSIMAIHGEATKRVLYGSELGIQYRVCVTLRDGTSYSVPVGGFGRLQSDEAKRAVESRANRLLASLYAIAPQARLG